MNKFLLAASAALIAVPAIAQDAAPAPAPLPVQQAQVGNAVLPAGTEILLKMTQDVTTKGRTWEEGDTFILNVVHDVTLGDYVVIPRGSKAVGRITWLTSKGMFGKSGKMDVELEYVEVGGRRIAVDGTYRQEGEGNTMATVGGVVLAGVFGGFITGRSGTIPQGRELMSTLESDLELAIPASQIGSTPTRQAPIATSGATMKPITASPADNSVEASVPREENATTTAGVSAPAASSE
ncbi:MAG: hypothetical protein WA936_07280 [Erythrobacter sp.]|uniref:hypothetical protein n=1 Tax=Erythrobacter sp. TaxID=1042 RepID=UPI003C708CE0